MTTEHDGGPPCFFMAQGKAGLRPRIIRKASGGCCPWCAALAGEYDYPDVSKDVYRRHLRCRCTVEYDPGYGRRRQDVWTKSWTSPEDRAKIEARKTYGLKKITKIKNSELKNGLPINGAANSTVDKTDDNGNVLQRRVYGPDGKAMVDYDTTDHGMPASHPTGAHKHVFDYTKKRARQSWEPLTEEELEENTDIIKRGVNYFDS